MSKIKKNIIIFYLKIIIFTAVKNCSILHRRVCVMQRDVGCRNEDMHCHIKMQLTKIENIFDKATLNKDYKKNTGLYIAIFILLVLSKQNYVFHCKMLKLTL